MNTCINCKYAHVLSPLTRRKCQSCQIIDSESFVIGYCNWEPSNNIKKHGAQLNADTEISTDMVNNPLHYKSDTGLEVIDVIKAFTSELKGVEATDTGNIIKYVCRWKKKNGVQDLEKAKWYLEHLIKQAREGEKENGNIK